MRVRIWVKAAERIDALLRTEKLLRSRNMTDEADIIGEAAEHIRGCERVITLVTGKSIDDLASAYLDTGTKI